MKSLAPSHVETLAQQGDALSASALLIRLSGALALVIVVILAIAWLARRSGWGNPLTKGKSALLLRHSLSLGQRERVVIVEAGNRWFLLGVTSASVTLLGELNSGLEEQGTSALPGGLFQQALLNATRQKGRSKP